MSDEQSSVTQKPSSRGRGGGRGRSRGGLGKYLRSRGRGHRGGGRPAEFHKRLVLEGEELEELEPDSEEAKELARKYARRQLGTNADRYAEPEPVLNSDGEEEREPEVDLSSFLARQRLDDAPDTVLATEDAEDDSDVDTSLVHIVPKSSEASRRHKGKIEAIEWNEELEELRREKEMADANRELKNRFKAKAEKQKFRQSQPISGVGAQAKARKTNKEHVVEAPPLPTDELTPKDERAQMEDFLDDLLG